MVVLLFTEIQGGSKTKQAAPTRKALLQEEKPKAARRCEGKFVAERLGVIKILKNVEAPAVPAL